MKVENGSDEKYGPFLYPQLKCTKMFKTCTMKVTRRFPHNRCIYNAVKKVFAPFVSPYFLHICNIT